MFTKREVVAMFKAHYLPEIEKLERPDFKDWPRRRMVWNDLTDALQKDGKITEHQRMTWAQPAFVRGPERR